MRTVFCLLMIIFYAIMQNEISVDLIPIIEDIIKFTFIFSVVLDTELLQKTFKKNHKKGN